MGLALLPARFAEKIQIEGECWVWTAWRIKNGYGRIQLTSRKPALAHRAVYEILVGPIPEGLTLDHLCRNRACVNPSHLEPVTMRENALRGIGPTAINARKTHCPKGHPFIQRGRQRICVQCRKAQNTGKPPGRKPQAFCKNGHDMSVSSRPNRKGCRICNNNRTIARYRISKSQED